MSGILEDPPEPARPFGETASEALWKAAASASPPCPPGYKNASGSLSGPFRPDGTAPALAGYLFPVEASGPPKPFLMDHSLEMSEFPGRTGPAKATGVSRPGLPDTLDILERPVGARMLALFPFWQHMEIFRDSISTSGRVPPREGA
jgi:hypothetical protein